MNKKFWQNMPEKVRPKYEGAHYLPSISVIWSERRRTAAFAKLRGDESRGHRCRRRSLAGRATRGTGSAPRGTVPVLLVVFNDGPRQLGPLDEFHKRCVVFVKADADDFEAERMELGID